MMQNKYAIVTGGSSGIGIEFAKQLASRQYSLLLVSNQPAQLADTRDSLLTKYNNIECHILNCDLSLDNAAAIVKDYCTEIGIFNYVDVLINNAGIFTFKEILNLSDSQINLYLNLHLRTITQLCRIFGDEMKNKHSGYILNMSSMSCWMPMPGIGMYAATKAYIRVFSRCLYLELKECGVNVMTACPGGIATDLFGLPNNLQRLGIRLGVLAKPQKFAANAIKRLFKDKKQYINGTINRIAIFVVALLPTHIRLFVKHKLLRN